jgi:colicin import membrane protein
MARRKNVKRIDPRYFLNETVNRDIDTGEALAEAGPSENFDADKYVGLKIKELRVRGMADFDKVYKHAQSDPAVEESSLPLVRDAVDKVKKLWAPRLKGAAQPAGTAPPDKFQQQFADVEARKDQKLADQAAKRAAFQKQFADVGARKARKQAGKLEEDCPPEGEGGEAIDISGPGVELHVDDISQLSPEEAFAAGMAAARDAIDQVMGGGESPPEEAEALEELEMPWTRKKREKAEAETAAQAKAEEEAAAQAKAKEEADTAAASAAHAEKVKGELPPDWEKIAQDYLKNYNAAEKEGVHFRRIKRVAASMTARQHPALDTIYNQQQGYMMPQGLSSEEKEIAQEKAKNSGILFKNKIEDILKDRERRDAARRTRVTKRQQSSGHYDSHGNPWEE